MPGRNRDLEILCQIIFFDEHDLPPNRFREYKATKAICITGEAGIGKTTLANEIIQRAHEPRHRKRFQGRIVSITCYLDDWDNVITNLARQIFAELPSKVTSAELAELVLTHIAKEKCLVLIDNIDRVAPESIKEFIDRWTRGDHESMLLLTSRDNPFHEEGAQNYKVYPLAGIPEEYVIRDLLKEELVRIIEKENLWESIGELQGNPQKLIFLSWLSLKDKKSIERCIRDLKDEEAGVHMVETVLKDAPYPMAHFLALARVRDPEFDDTLLAFLWDRLGGGSTETYIRTLKWLLGKKLLTFEGGYNWQRFRLSAGVHLGLERPLVKHIGENRIPNIEYFISEYYRNLFTNSRAKTFELHLLERYVYHALRAHNFKSAYAYVFDSDILDVAHKRGLSLELEPILGHFNKEWWERNLKEQDGSLAEKGAKIKIELGRIYKDLSLHQLGLEYLDEADNILNEPVACGIDQEVKRHLKRRIWHYSAISKSQIGSTEECMDFYFMVVKDAIEHNSFTSFDALSLGYLAHELKYHDIKKAEELGRKACDLSSQINDENTRIKNLCSLGLILFYLGRKEESKMIFERATIFFEAAPPDYRDKRELGRILANSMVVYLADRDWDEAEKRLADCLTLNEKFRDQRRAAMTYAYRAIMLDKKGEREEAKKVMLDAIKQHRKVQSWRELANEVLTYLWMIDPGFTGDLKQIDDIHMLPTEIQDCVNHFQTKKELKVFLDFWRDYFKPLILDN